MFLSLLNIYTCWRCWKENKWKKSGGMKARVTFNVIKPDKIFSIFFIFKCFNMWGIGALRHWDVIDRNETIWQYIDTVSIRRLTIRIVAQCDISRYDLDICNQGKSPRCVYSLYLTSFSYSFKKYNLCGRCLCKMPVEMDL